jgi:hypothetical protein
MNKKVVIITLFIITVFCLVICSVFIWPPDLFSSKQNILAQAESDDGSKFTVVQFWNGKDFYTTMLKFKPIGAEEEDYVIDGDDIKRWKCRLVLDASKKMLEVILSGKSSGTLQWSNNVFTRRDGQVLRAVNHM